MRLLDSLLRRVVRKGRLEVVDADGTTRVYGGEAPGPEVAVRITRPGAADRIALNPELRAPEAYMDGLLEFEKGDVHDFVALYILNRPALDRTPTQIFWSGVRRRLRRLQQHNPISRARANARSHYDIGEEIYRLFLDRDMQYSCAYFPTGNETLDQAQLLKKRRIASKLRIRDGQRVLDIGSGWGGMALYLAHAADVEVTGITLSRRQLEVSRRRAEILGVSDRVRFEPWDYREVQGRYDRIVSVGMLEHVGAHHLSTYFLRVRDMLEAEGVALIHSISSIEPPGVTGPFIRKHIFPGGYTPSLSESAAAVERSGMWLLDCEIWRMHYGRTLAEWRRRFAAHRDRARDVMGERFCRMWELYLSASECAFMLGTANVFQLQLGRRRDAAPITRDYLADESARLEARDSGFADRVAASAFEALDERVMDRRARAAAS